MHTKDYPVMKILPSLCLAGMLAALAGSASAESVFPSGRYLLLSSPYSPTSHEECQKLGEAFDAEIRQLNAQHDECLKDAPRDDHGGGTCSKASCQGLHTARDEAGKKSRAETGTCRERVNAYLEKKRQEEAEARRLKAEAEKQAREAEERRAESARQEKQRRAEQERREHDEVARQDQQRRSEQARRERDEDARRAQHQRDEAQRRAEKSKREREDDQRRAESARKQETREEARERAREAASERRERERQEREDREEARQARAAAEQREREAELAVQKAQQEAAQRERNKRDQTIYDKLLKEIKDGKEKASTALEYARNPFLAPAADAVQGGIKKAMDAAIDRALPGAEAHDRDYDRAADIIDKTRAKALEGNPFAEKVSGTAMEGINKIHRKTLGELEQVSQAIENFGRDDTGAGGGTTGRSPSYPASNPFIAPSAPASYYDPNARTTLEIPAGSVLYRAPDTGQLAVIPYADLRDIPATGDQPGLDGAGCGATGIGVVMPECEKKRRARVNPFGNR
jgi:hypothetical protein